MLNAFKLQSIPSMALKSAKTAPRIASSFIHSQALQQDTSAAPNDAPIHAFGARLGLQKLDTSILKQALTHKSIESTPNNAKLEFIGRRVIGLFATEYVHVKYPTLYNEVFVSTVGQFVGMSSFVQIAREIGLQHVVQWKASETDGRPGQNFVLDDCLRAIVGAVYQEQGQEAAKKFVHDFVLAREFDVKTTIDLQDPKRHLSAVLRQLNKEAAVSKLLSETGRHSISPVFVVGVFSGKTKLGEGFGGSMKMAEHRACRDFLREHYGKQEKDFVLPSDADKVDKYVAKPLGITQAII